jgi:hypothetical protein
VSSRRRDYFFKRGGNGTYKDSIDTRSVLVASWQQINKDRDDAAAAQAKKDAEKAQELSYPDVDNFVSMIKTTNVSEIMDTPVKFSILKLPQKIFDTYDVKDKNKQSPVTRKIDGKTVEFYISHSGCNFYIYVDNTLYGQLQITAPNGIVIATDTICRLVPQIKSDLIASPST